MSFASIETCDAPCSESPGVEARLARGAIFEAHGDPAGCSRGEFELRIALAHGGVHKAVLRWQRLGDAALPAIVVQGGISADRCSTALPPDEAPGWWQAQVGAGRAFDPAHVQVLSIDWLGADGTLDAPIDTADQADAIAAALDRLGVARIEAFVGCSYGALVGLQFAARYPNRLRRLVAIAGAHRPHPYASALRAIQRKVVALGQLQCVDELGLSLARQLAMLTYRAPEEFALRFADGVVLDGAHARCASEDYLEAQGTRYAERWSPTAFLRLSESIDLHRVDPARIGVPTTLVAVHGDRLVPPEDVHELAAGIGAPTRVHVLRSLFGHDAFLKETVLFDALLRDVCAVACGGAA